tara:strand:- start:5398 stop:5688 length:291 start_codon:yes stop_codon:yes gene_type:complete
MVKNIYYPFAVEQKDNPNTNIAQYATLVVDEYNKYYNDSITLQQFIDNTPMIDSGVWPEQINHIRCGMIDTIQRDLEGVEYNWDSAVQEWVLVDSA